MTKIYGGSKIKILNSAKEQIKRLEELGFGNLPICIAKLNIVFR